MLQTQQQPALNKYLLIKTCIGFKYNKKDKNSSYYLLPARLISVIIGK